MHFLGKCVEKYFTHKVIVIQKPINKQKQKANVITDLLVENKKNKSQKNKFAYYHLVNFIMFLARGIKHLVIFVLLSQRIKFPYVCA